MRRCIVGQAVGGVLLGGLALSLAGGCGASPTTLRETSDTAVTGQTAMPRPTPTPPPAAQPISPAAEQIAMAANSTPLPPADPVATPNAVEQSPVHLEEAHGQAERLTMEQVATWAQQGTRDDIIIDRIERAQIIFRVSAADEQMLRQQGVSEDVICALKETTRR